MWPPTPGGLTCWWVVSSMAMRPSPPAQASRLPAGSTATQWTADGDRSQDWMGSTALRVSQHRTPPSAPHEYRYCPCGNRSTGSSPCSIVTLSACNTLQAYLQVRGHIIAGVLMTVKILHTQSLRMEYEVWSMECSVWNVGYGVWSAVYGI